MSLRTNFPFKKRTAVSGLTGLWAFLMLTVFPFYMKDHYAKLGQSKFDFFLAVSVLCLLPAGALALLERMDQKETQRRAGLSALDWAVLSYVLAACVSWLFAADKGTAWTGVDGWSMGLRTQLFFGLAYFLVSRYFPWKRLIFAGHFLASGAVFALGILHRFSIDPLGMYEGLGEETQRMFLSTIGQASWYSSYVCVVLVIGVTAFFTAKGGAVRMALGAYCMLGFGTVVTQNSDSAFAAAAFLFLGLFVVSCGSLDRMERFFETLLLMFGSFKVIGILQILFPEKAVELDRLSLFFSQSTAVWVLFLAVCVCYIALLFYRQRHEEKTQITSGRLWRRGACILTGAGIAGYVFAVWANTTGLLEKWFGFSSRNQYLLFDRYWGNSRGFSWKFTLEAFRELPPVRKLVGVGPDSFSAYCYADGELTRELNRYFGHDQMLTNAHNEFLNVLFCMGIVGLIAFTAIFAAAAVHFFQAQKTAAVAMAGLLAALVYGAHNFFCYQQVCCTPFLFLILGMAESCARGSRKAAENDRADAT